MLLNVPPGPEPVCAVALICVATMAPSCGHRGYHMSYELCDVIQLSLFLFLKKNNHVLIM